MTTTDPTLQIYSSSQAECIAAVFKRLGNNENESNTEAHPISGNAGHVFVFEDGSCPFSVQLFSSIVNEGRGIDAVLGGRVSRKNRMFHFALIHSITELNFDVLVLTSASC